MLVLVLSGSTIEEARPGSITMHRHPPAGFSTQADFLTATLIRLE
jgi:hypothetical protein